MSLLSVSDLVRESSFLLALDPGCIADVERHTDSAPSDLPHRSDNPNYSTHVELMEAGIEPRTFRLQGQRFTD